MKRALTVIALLGMAALAGCTSTRETIPSRSGIEQLLVSSAVDRLVEKIDIAVPRGTKLLVEAKTPGGFDADYAISALRDKFARRGAALVNDAGKADWIAEVRLGALSVDKSDSLLGIPEYEVPLPLTDGLTFPELALWKRELRQGVVKVGITTYDARTGELQASLAPQHGFSYRAHYVAMLFFSWTNDNLIPEEDRPGRGPLW